MSDEKINKQEIDHKPGWKKALWFIVLWLLGVLTLASIGGVIKLFLG